MSSNTSTVRAVKRELASGPLAAFEENNVNEISELSLDRRKSTGNVRARWYDPSTGSFLSPDPLGYQDSSNLYAFAGGDLATRVEISVVVSCA